MAPHRHDHSNFSCTGRGRVSLHRRRPAPVTTPLSEPSRGVLAVVLVETSIRSAGRCTSSRLSVNWCQLTGERRPGPDAPSGSSDNKRVPLRLLGNGWAIGMRGYLEVDDETHHTYAIWHKAATILLISDAVEKTTAPVHTDLPADLATTDPAASRYPDGTRAVAARRAP